MYDSMEIQLDVILNEIDVRESIEMTDEMMSDSSSDEMSDSSSDDESATSSSMDDEISSQKDSFAAKENAASHQEEAAQKDDAVYVFRGHLQDKERYCWSSLFRCAMSKNGQLAATGSLVSKTLLWNAVTGEIIIECATFGATFIEFNYNDIYLAIASMFGEIQVWQISTKSCVLETRIGDVILWMKWHKSSDVLLVCGKTSKTESLYTLKVPNGTRKVVTQRYGDSVESFVIFPDGQRAAIGFRSGLIRVVNLKTNTVLCNTHSDHERLHGHQYAVTAIDCHPTNNMLISGSWTGQVILSSASTGKILSLLYDPKLPVASRVDEVRVEAVAFSRNPSLHVVAVALTHNASTLHGRLLIWNTWNMKFTLRHELGSQRASKIAWTSTDVLFAAGRDGVLRSYDARAGKCLRVFRGHINGIMDLHICENEKKALTFSRDFTARIFDISSLSNYPYLLNVED